MSRWRQPHRTAASAGPGVDQVSRRVHRGLTCPVCGRRRREMRVFGTPRHDASGTPKSRRMIRAELADLAGGWRPDPLCDRCRRSPVNGT
ncbi:hypothetical protein GCM10027445_31830 [Amycolatopsis endophytica]|uniref:Uncharacterized protein n=1 Tax=Amycolatopsis endophytica TaxID=860233 RepID=A0A853B1V1_9PSEU|nr:hypothetical protein [Amycolatopsis endophytica]NYI88807.1 hypothetical protein [Amycolatopsis endophytica]